MSNAIEEKLQENKMGVMPVNQLLLNMSLPMMISMLVQALYNIVDSIFVAKRKCTYGRITCISDTDAFDSGWRWNRCRDKLIVVKTIGGKEFQAGEQDCNECYFFGGSKLFCLCDYRDCGCQTLLCKSD